MLTTNNRTFLAITGHKIDVNSKTDWGRFHEGNQRILDFEKVRIHVLARRIELEAKAAAKKRAEGNALKRVQADEASSSQSKHQNLTSGHRSGSKARCGHRFSEASSEDKAAKNGAHAMPLPLSPSSLLFSQQPRSEVDLLVEKIQKLVLTEKKSEHKDDKLTTIKVLLSAAVMKFICPGLQETWNVGRKDPDESKRNSRTSYIAVRIPYTGGENPTDETFISVRNALKHKDKLGIGCLQCLIQSSQDDQFYWELRIARHQISEFMQKEKTTLKIIIEKFVRAVYRSPESVGVEAVAVYQDPPAPLYPPPAPPRPRRVLSSSSASSS